MFSDPLQTIFLLGLAAALPCLLFMRKALVTSQRDRVLLAVLLFVVASTTASLSGVYLGGILLMADFWGAPGGGAAQLSSFLYVGVLFIFLALILFDSISLAGLSRFSGMTLQSKFSLGLVGTVVVLCQAGCFLVMQKIEPLGFMSPRPKFGSIDKSGQPLVKPTDAESEKQEASQSKLIKEEVLDDLRVNSSLCVLSWRDGTAWSKTAKDGPGWLLEVDKLLADHQEDDELIAIKAAINSALYPPNLSQAEEGARRAVTANSKNALALGVLGHCLSLRRAYKQAIVEFDKALVSQPRNIEWLAARGLCYEDMNENAQAVKDYTAMISLAPHLAWPYGSRAHAYLALNKADKAIGDVNTVLRIEPKNVFAHKQMADAYVHKKQWDKALGALLNAEAEIDPLSWEMDELLAMRETVLELKRDKTELAKVRMQIKALRKKLKS